MATSFVDQDCILPLDQSVSPPVAVWELNSISQSWAETRAIPHNKPADGKREENAMYSSPPVSERWQITFLNSHHQTQSQPFTRRSILGSVLPTK